MSDFDSVLVLDGECPFCSAAATALRRLPTAGAVSWDDPAAQAFLRAQFDEVPFALAFVDAAEARLYLGRAAARELCERAGVPVLARDLIGDNYEAIADVVRAIADNDRDPDPYYGVVPLADAAASRFDELAERADGTRITLGDQTL